jgi:hypothetical protein
MTIVACGGSEPPALVTNAEASAEVEASLAKLATSFIAGDATGAMTIASPSDACITATIESSQSTSGTTTYHYASCHGVTGDVTVAWATEGPTFHAEVSASSLVVDGANVASWTASADVTASGAQRTMVWQSSSSGTIAARGSLRAFTRDSDATLSWTLGASCVNVDGQASGAIDVYHLSTRTTSFVACDGACPSAGSALRADDVDHPGVFVRVLYGEGSATYTNESGESFTFVPACASP